MQQPTPPKASVARADVGAPQPPAYACSHCQACGFNNFPPADVCPKCWSEKAEQRDLSAQGVLYSYTTIGSADALQYVGYVDLPENVRVFGLLNTTQAPACGVPVTLSAVRAPGSGPCFVFDLVAKQGA